jgi:hypothetical protein
MAFGKSSRATISALNDWRTGISNALTIPTQNATVAMCQICTTPVPTKTPRTAAKTSEAQFVHSKVRRLSTRSAMAPAYSVSSRIGIEPHAATPAIKAGSGVILRISQPCAVCCAHVPISEIRLPAQNKRKLRCAKAGKREPLESVASLCGTSKEGA